MHIELFQAVNVSFHIFLLNRPNVQWEKTYFGSRYEVKLLRLIFDEHILLYILVENIIFVI
jgi:hypothetical protein